MFWNRKKLIFALIIFLVLSLFFMYKDNIRNEKTIQTNGTPVSNYTVILDAGHGQPDRTVQLHQMEFKRKK